MYNFLKILKEILRFFENVEKFYPNFRENVGKNLENFGNMDLQGVRGGSPEASENIKKLVEKSMETFHEFLANFDLKKLILIKKLRQI